MTDKQMAYDLPRLAKESGFYFHFHNKRLEWQQIAELDIEEITSNRNFRLLEEKMDLVINCDLNDDVAKVLDRDFVKLFRLAQLSIGYLRHCQWCLDRCVLLLQEKLDAAQKECDSLKGTQNYSEIVQCNKCDKSFLTESYLVSHQKRRHTDKPSLIQAATQTDEITKMQNKGQQTDTIRISSVEIQTESIRNHNVGVGTEVDESKEVHGEMELRHVLERIKAVETDLSSLHQNKISEKISDPPLQVQHICTDSIVTQPELLVAKIEDTQANSEMADLTKIIKQLVPLVQNLQNNKFDRAHEEKEVIANETSIQSEEVLIDFGTSSPKRKNESKESVPYKENSSTESSHNEPQTRPRTRTRKKVYLSQETEQVPQPTPRRPLALRRQKTTSNSEIEIIMDRDVIKQKEVETVKPFTLNFTEQLQEKSDISELASEDKKLIDDVKHTDQVLDVYSGSYKDEPSLQSTPVKINTEKATPTLYQPVKKEESPRVAVEEAIVKKSRKEASLTKSTFFRKLVKNRSTNLKGLTTSLRKSWSNIYDASRRKQQDRRGNMLDHSDDNRSEAIRVNEIVNEKLRELAVDPEWEGIPEDTFVRTMSVLKQQQHLKAKTIPGHKSVRDAIEQRVGEEVQMKKESIRSTNQELLNTPSMYDIEVSDEESDDYAANVEYSEDKKTTTPQLSTNREWEINEVMNNTSSKLNGNFKLPTPDIEVSQVSSEMSSSSSGSPVRVTTSIDVRTREPSQNVISQNDGTMSPYQNMNSPYTLSVKDSLIHDISDRESMNSTHSSLETNLHAFSKSPAIANNGSTANNAVDDIIASFLKAEKDIFSRNALERESTGDLYSKATTPQSEVGPSSKIIKKSSMYSVDDSSSIASIEDSPPRISKQTKDTTIVQPLTFIVLPERKDTDLSIFQIGGKRASTNRENGIGSSDSEVDEKETTSKLKSALQSKSKDEIRKRVVFADNFPLELGAGSSALLNTNVPNTDSGSDWDIPM